MDIVILIWSTLCIIVTIKIISAIYRYFVLRRTLKNIPSMPVSYPFIGETILLMRMSEVDQVRWYLRHTEMFPNGLYVLWFGMTPIVHIYNPEYLEVILHSTSHIGKELPYTLLEPWLGKGLLTSTGTQWFHDRRMIGPTFHFTILEQFAVIFSEKAELLTKCLEEAIEKNSGKPIDIFPFALNVAIDIICETAMDVNINAQMSENNYTSTVRRTSTLTLERFYRPWYWIDWLYYSLPAGKEYKKMLNILHRFTTEVRVKFVSDIIHEKDHRTIADYHKLSRLKVINKRKNARQLEDGRDKEGSDEEQLDIGKKKRKAFLDLLLDQNEKDDSPLSDDELRAQVDTFMFEGHDTTAVAITWALFCLGNNLEHQEKVHRELEDVFGDSQTPASMSELSQLKYLERVMKESLRLFPSVPEIMRKLKETVKIGEYTIPKGTVVDLILILTHRDPKVWPDPLKFDPDRFLPENSKHRNPYAYVPFSAGPRNCVGQRFAQLEEKIILTAILRKWRVKSVKSMDEIRFSAALILRPYDGVLIHFTPKK